MLCCAVLVGAGSDLIMSHAQVYDVSDRLLLSTLRNIEAWLSVRHSLTPCNHSLVALTDQAGNQGRPTVFSTVFLPRHLSHGFIPNIACSNS